MRVVTRIRIGKDKIFIGKGVKEMLDAIELCKSIKKKQRNKQEFPIQKPFE